MTKKTRIDVYQEVTNTIINLLESGTLTGWKKKWVGDTPFNPQNAHTGNSYNGVNVLLLANSMIKNSYKENSWCTFKQAQKLGYKVTKGSKGTRIVFFKKLEFDENNTGSDGETEKKEIYFLKQSTVFNVAQLDSYEPNIETKLKCSFIDSPETEAIIKNASNEIIIKHEGSTPCYIPKFDMIKMPLKEAFSAEGAYYATFLHELGHATGAKSRLNRDMGGLFGDKKYAFEELIAELTSVFVSAHINVAGEEIENHANYVSSWIKGLKKDKKIIFKAASEAQKATNYILSEWAENRHKKIA